MTQREDVRFKVYTKASVDVFGSNTTAAARGAPRHDQRRGGWGLRRGPFVSISIIGLPMRVVSGLCNF